MANLILFNKPFRVMCQFTDETGDGQGNRRPTLADWITIPGVYPAGRLDYDSEGLLLLTNDGQLQNLIASPRQKMPKTYWVQVEGTPTAAALQKLREGVALKDGMTRPATVEPIAPPNVWPRHPPVRYREAIPTRWLSITLTEGRNRQVRRMTAAVGFPTLRLIRYCIGNWTLDGLAPGELRTLNIHPPARPSTSSRSVSRGNPVRKTSRKRPRRPTTS